MTQIRNEYRNDSPGIVGVITITDGKSKGIGVKPGDTVWLSEQERIATANAPKKDEDNPLANGDLTLVTPAAEIKNRRPIGADDLSEQPQPAPQAAVEPEKSEPESEDEEPTPEEVAAKEAARKQAKVAEAKKQQAQKQAESPGKPVDETGAAVQPEGLPHQGSRAPQEEVATPEAPAKAGAKG